MTAQVKTRNSCDAVTRKTYDQPVLRCLGSVTELTLGALVTAMPENGGSGTSQV